MGLFSKKIKKVESEEFKQPQPMTNGNKYDVFMDLARQAELDINSIVDDISNVKGIDASKAQLKYVIQQVSKRLIDEKNIEPYYLLQAQGDYFCGTCRFDTNDVYLKRMIISVIRGAFMLGCAGIYKDTTLNNLQPVYISNVELGIDNNIKSCRILPLSVCLNKMSETKSNIEPNKLRGFRTLNEEQCKNLSVFNWGTMGYSAWINKWPFVKLQHMLLKIIIIYSFVFNKKWIYKINNQALIEDEMELFFSPENPFLVSFGNMDNIANRFSVEDVAKAGLSNDVIDYYNKTIGVYYHLMGRKINNDFKKERNVSNEVEASQENYDIVQSDWLNQFDCFIKDLKTITGIDVWIVKDKDVQGEMDNKDDSIRTDNQ